MRSSAGTPWSSGTYRRTYAPSGSSLFSWARRVVDAIRPRVDAGTRDPLPVADVLRHVAVEKEVEEVARTVAPVDPEVLDEERGRHHPCAVVHPALCPQLTHARVDERKARHPLLPGLEPVGVVDPAVAARPQVVHLRLGTRSEELGVEVAPAELPDERVRIRSSPFAGARRKRPG